MFRYPMLPRVFLLSYLLAFSAAFATEWSADYSNSKFPGKCFIPPNIVLNPGVKYSVPNLCQQIVCKVDGMAAVQSCTLSVLTPPCRHGNFTDLDKPYPICCNRAILCD